MEPSKYIVFASNTLTFQSFLACSIFLTSYMQISLSYAIIKRYIFYIGFTLGITSLLGFSMYIVQVETSSNTLPFKETKKVNQVIFCSPYCLWFFAKKLENFNFDDGAFISFWSYLVDNLLCAGIISSIAFSPSCTGMLATGSYSQTTGIYREDNMELLYVLHGQEGGVTHVSWNLSFREFFLWVEKEGILFNAFFFFLQLFFDLSAPIF